MIFNIKNFRIIKKIWAKVKVIYKRQYLKAEFEVCKNEFEYVIDVFWNV